MLELTTQKLWSRVGCCHQIDLTHQLTCDPVTFAVVDRLND